MLTVREAAQVLQLSRQGTIDMLRSGRMEGKKIPSPNAKGFYWLIPESEVSRMKAQRREQNMKRKYTLVAVMDCRGERSLRLYAVPPGTTNPQDAVHYEEVGYWSEDTSMPNEDGSLWGCWIGHEGNGYIAEGQTNYTTKDDFPYIGEAY